MASHYTGISSYRAWALGLEEFSSCRSWSLDRRLSNCGTHRLRCSAACRIFLDLGLNWCLLHRQVDRLLCKPPGKPWGVIVFFFFLTFFLLLLKDNSFTEFCCFLSNLNMNQLSVYIYPLPFETASHLPPHATPLGWYRAPV